MVHYNSMGCRNCYCLGFFSHQELKFEQLNQEKQMSSAMKLSGNNVSRNGGLDPLTENFLQSTSSRSSVAT